MRSAHFFMCSFALISLAASSFHFIHFENLRAHNQEPRQRTRRDGMPVNRPLFSSLFATICEQASVRREKKAKLNSIVKTHYKLMLTMLLEGWNALAWCMSEADTHERWETWFDWKLSHVPFFVLVTLATASQQIRFHRITCSEQEVFWYLNHEFVIRVHVICHIPLASTLHLAACGIFIGNHSGQKQFRKVGVTEMKAKRKEKRA